MPACLQLVLFTVCAPFDCQAQSAYFHRIGAIGGCGFGLILTFSGNRLFMVAKNICLYLLLMFSVSLSMAQQNRGMSITTKDPETGAQLKIYSDMWAVVIGINKYRYWPPLRFAVQDADAVTSMLIRKYGFRKDHLILLRDNEATLQGIKGALSTLIDKTGTDDGVMFFFAGHGQTYKTKEGKEMGYIIPVDGKTEDNKLYTSALPMTEVKNLSNLIPAKHILFLVDACYSGLAAAADYRGKLYPSTKGFLKKVSKAKTRQIITAGGAGEQVQEREDWGHSAFTYELLNGLDREQADRNNDGIITSDELADYLTSRVSTITDNAQLPQSQRLSPDEGKFVFVQRGANDDNSEAKEVSLTEMSPEKSSENVPDGMVSVPEGSFDMGSNDGIDDEKPMHRVYISKFYLDKCEVTVAQFKQFVDATSYQTEAEKDNGSKIWTNGQWEIRGGVNWRFDEKGSLRGSDQFNHPVIHVSWNDAAAYAAWAGKRLPTEAEWEYAARCGIKQYRYSWGNGEPSGHYGGNIRDESAKSKIGGNEIWTGYSDGFVFSSPVGSFDPNDFGLYDMTGNVWEWCADRYDRNYYGNSPERDPQGPSNGRHGIYRGGSWNSGRSLIRTTIRGGTFLTDPLGRGADLGFRCAKSF